MRRTPLGLSLLLVLVVALVGGGLLVARAGNPADVDLGLARAEPVQQPPPTAPDGGGDDATTAAVDTPPAPPVSSGLTDRMDQLLADPALAGRHVSVSVLDAGGGPVYERAADLLSTPASTQKMLVAAAALATLGPEWRYETRVAAAAPPDASGVLAGPLVLVGAGDPALATPTYGSIRHDRPRTPLELLADRVVAAGVRRVVGPVVGDESIFPHEPVPAGWPARYFAEGNGTLTTGLTVDGGRHLFWQRGRIQSVPAGDPARDAAAALIGLLEERGVVVEGGAMGSRTPVDAPVELATVVSPPLAELLRHVVQRSDNQLADGIHRTVGLVQGDGTWNGAAAGVRRALAPAELDWQGTVIADGSGLSRDNRIPAGLLSRLDWSMHQNNAAATWRSLYAVSGESGTLLRRLPNTLAERQLLGKTGSLRDVRTLSGVVDGPDGSRYHFAVIGNGLDRDGNASVRALQDAVVLTLLEDLWGCPALAPPGEPFVCAA